MQFPNIEVSKKFKGSLKYIFQAKSGKEFLVVNEAWSGKNWHDSCRADDELALFEVLGFLICSHSLKMICSDKNAIAGVKHPGDHIKFSLLGDYNQVLDLWHVLIQFVCANSNNEPFADFRRGEIYLI